MISALQTILESGLPDQAIQGDELPWVAQGDGVMFKPLRFDLATGHWINLLKISKGGKVNRHRHTGPVVAYTIQGNWHYLEREWVARAGTLVFEPPGDIHTLVVDEGVEMITLFYIQGAIQYLDDQDNLIYQDDVFTKLSRYRNHCKEHGIAEKNLFF